MAVVAVWATKVRLVEQQTRERFYTEDRANRSNRHLEEECRQIDRAALVKCISDEIEAERSYQRGESDLSAQEQMAAWSYWLLIVGVVGLGVSGGGLFALLISLDHTRVAIRDNREIGEAQTRAYIYVDAVEIRNIGTSRAPEGWLMLKNSGQTPAYELERRAGFIVSPFPTNVFPALNWNTQSEKAYIGPKGEIFFGGIPFNRTLSASELADVINGVCALYVFGEVRYVDAFKKKRTTKFCSLYRGDGTAPPTGVASTIHHHEGNECD